MLFEQLRGDVGLVPTICPHEVANALLVAERRGRLSPARIDRARQLLLQLPIDIVERPLADAFDAVLPVARREGLSVFDAAYVNLAGRESRALATLDRRMRAAAERLGIPLAEVGTRAG